MCSPDSRVRAARNKFARRGLRQLTRPAIIATYHYKRAAMHDTIAICAPEIDQVLANFIFIILYGSGRRVVWQHTSDGLLIKLHWMACPNDPAVFVQ